MKSLKMYFNMLIIAYALFVVSSCSNKAAKADDQEVRTMDSVAKDLDQSTKQLDEQASKVEASLEKLDKEFETAK